MLRPSLRLLLIFSVALGSLGPVAKADPDALTDPSPITGALVVEFGSPAGLSLADAPKSKAGFELEFRHWTHYLEVLMTGRSIIRYTARTLGKNVGYNFMESMPE